MVSGPSGSAVCDSGEGSSSVPAESVRPQYGVVGGLCMSMAVEREEDVDSLRYFLARRTLLEMLRDRGYDINPAELRKEYPEFKAWWELLPDLDRLAVHVPLLRDPSKKILVQYFSTEPVKMKTIRDMYAQIREIDFSRLIVILQSKMTFKAKEAINEMFSFKVETFQITDLLANISTHTLKPNHEVLSKEQKAELMEKYKVEDSQLPRMLEADAISRYYGMDKGLVVEVTYDKDHLAGTHVSYRCVR